MKLVLIFLSLLFLTACSTTNCGNERRFNSAKNGDQNTKMTLDKGALNMKKVKVAKADGTLQCSQGKLIPLLDMQKDLKEITVFSALNQNDGMMRIQVCGAATGNHNVYEILETDLEKAKSFGFKLWTK
jgi:hypothetical protein